MLRRRLMFSAALVAAGVGLVPGLARAADRVAPDTARAVSAPQPDLAEAKTANVQSFASPADRTVRTPAPGAKGGATAQAQDAAGDAYLAIGLDAMQYTGHSVELRSIVTREDAALDITISWGDGTTDKVAVAAGPDSDIRHTKHKYAAVGSYEVKVTVKDTTHDVQAENSLTFVTSGTEFTPHEPTRVLDTRTGLSAAQRKVAGRSSLALKVAGVAKVPAGVRSVVLNVTVTNTTGPGHITAGPAKDLAEGAETSNLNYVAGQTVPNLVIAPVGEDGSVYLFNGGWESVDLIADVTGYFTATTASGYNALTPTRAVDTRAGVGTAKGQVPGHGTFGVEIAGRGGVPKNATAVALNLTATNPRAAGHLTVYPSGQAAPATSSLNFTAGQTVANAVIVPVGPDGKITVRNGSWDAADVVIDVAGFYSPDSRSALVVGGVPYRIQDTRKDSWAGRKAGPVAARSYLPLPLDGDSYPIDGWVLNTTVTNTSGAGFLSVAGDPNEWSAYKNGTAVTPERPVSSVLNWTAGATVPNLVQTAQGKHGVIDFWNQGWEPVDVVIDLVGSYQTG